MQSANIESNENETLTSNDGLTDQDALFEQLYNSITEGSEVKLEPEETQEEVKEVPDNQDPQPNTAQPDDPNEWLNSLPEDVRGNVQALVEEHANLQHRYSSVYNRLAPTQRRLSELERKFKEQQDPQTRQPAQNGNASEKSVNPQVDEEWERIKESDPVLAAAFERKLKQQQDEFDQRIQRSLQPYQEQSHNQELERETQALLQIVPNAIEVFSHPSYHGWIENQSEAVKRLNSSTKHQDALALLRLYDADMQPYYQQQSQQQSAPPVNPNAAKLQQKRDEKLQNPVPQSAAKAAPKQEEVDINKLFDEIYKKELGVQSKSHGIQY